MLRQSRLPLEKTLESFDLKRLPAKVSRQVRSLTDGAFVERCENVLAFGKPGSGKTHLLAGLSQELIRQGKRVYFSPCSLLVQELLIAKRDLKLSRVIKRLSRFDAILDRRHWLRATESRGNGSSLHTVGRTLRARQRHADK